MATLTIRNLDDDVRDRLRVRAARNGRSMEAEVRAILVDTVEAPAGEHLGSRIHRRFARTDVGGIEVPARSEPARAAELPG